jgi:phosphate transport system protein
MLATHEEHVNNIKSNIENLGQSLVLANEAILASLTECNTEIFEEAKGYIKNSSKKTAEIDDEVIKVLALYAPEAKDLRIIVAYLKISNELLRASTNTRSFIKGFSDVCEDLDVKAVNEYAIPMQNSTIKAVKAAIEMISIDDEDELQEAYNEVMIEESKTDDLYEMVEKSLYTQAEEANNFKKYHNMLRALRKSEKIADRASSIASLVLHAKMGRSLPNHRG